jgi:dTDP-4-amino-4,6-dideoxygalactose transaminase
MFYILTADLEERTGLIAHLRKAGILAVFHYVPLHSSPFARSIGLPQARLPVTEKLSSRLVRLPMYYDLANHEAEQVARCVTAFYARQSGERASGERRIPQGYGQQPIQ